MSVELLCRAPLWLGKAVVNTLVRRCIIKYNKIKPPTKWGKKAVLESVEDVKEKEIILQLDKGTAKILSITPGVLLINVKDDKKHDFYSEAILKPKTSPNLKYFKRKDQITISQKNTESALKIVFQIGSSIFKVQDNEGTLLCIDEFYRKSEEGGWYSFTSYAGSDNEHYFGFGETAKPFDKRDSTVGFWNTDSFAYSSKATHLYQSLPIKVVVRENGYCYAVIYDNPYKSMIKIEKEKGNYATKYFVKAGGINYYIVLGPTIPDLFHRLTNLLGNAPLPPISTLGHHQSRWSYYPEEEVRTLAKKFREKKIPCDWIHLDIDYMNGYRIFTFNKERFPNPRKLADDLKEQGFKLVAITDPGVKVDENYEVCMEGIEGEHFCKNTDGTLYKGAVWPGECYFPDFSQEKTRKWFGSKFSSLIEQGIKGFWIDMNEPSVFCKKGTIEDDIIHPHNGEQKRHAEIHNQYGFLMAKATYEGAKEFMQNERVFVLTRAAYLGIQRYAGSWTGDNIAEWEHLALTLPMLMNMSVSGQVMIGPDIGGFLGKPSEELLIRWYQAALGYPFYRNHTINKLCSQEPWVYGEKAEKIIRNAIRLRYKLLIYIYNAIREQCLTGLPAFRPLWVEFPTDKEIYNSRWSETEYLIGSSILVAPVLKRRQRKRKVYLPKESNWYDIEGKYYKGGQIYEIPAPIDYLPLFIREGTIIPVINAEIQYTEELYNEKIDLLLAPKENQAEGQIYLDDGATLEYKKGDYEVVTVSAKKEKDGNWYITITREGKANKYVKIDKITFVNEKHANYVIFEK